MSILQTNGQTRLLWVPRSSKIGDIVHENM